MDEIASLTKALSHMTRPHPARDWMIIAVMSCIVCVIGVGVSAQLFLSIQTGSLVSGGTNAPKPTIPVTQEAIRGVLETYQTRAAAYVSKSFVVYDLSDPRKRR
jgi:hypothetical protein